jgi:hypothetical protein
MQHTTGLHRPYRSFIQAKHTGKHTGRKKEKEMKNRTNDRLKGTLLFVSFFMALVVMVALYTSAAHASTAAPTSSHGIYSHGTETEHGTETPQATESHEGEATKTEQPEGTETEQPEGTETERPEGTETERPEGTETERPEATETEHPEGTETERPEGTETEHPEGTETPHPEGTESGRDSHGTPEATETEHPRETETAHPETTETERPGDDSGHHNSGPNAGSNANGANAAPAAVPGNGSRTFKETGKTVSGVFLQRWDSSGGLAQQGFPVSGVMNEASPLDGKTYTVQYFERSVMEYHPENAAPNNVLLSQLGTFRFKEKYANGTPDQTTNKSNGHFFPETGHWVGGTFLQYWQQHGGLAQQGYPISEEFNEVSPLDGKTYKVQYFERAVFEYHPEQKDPKYQVLLSQLGTFRYQQVYTNK